jgi:hypothetical protein
MISFACICDENLYFEIQPLIRNDSLVYVQPFFFCIFVKPFFCSFFWLFHFILPQILGRLLLNGPCGEMNETFVLKSILISIFVANIFTISHNSKVYFCLSMGRLGLCLWCSMPLSTIF